MSASRKVGRGQAHESKYGARVVAHRVGMGGRVDSDRNRDDVGDHHGGHRQDDRQHDALADQVGDRPVVGGRLTEVAAKDDVGDPLPVLDVERIPEAPALVEGFDCRLVQLHPEPLHVVEEVVDPVTRRKLDHGEGNEGQHNQHQDHVEQPPPDVARHHASLRPPMTAVKEAVACDGFLDIGGLGRKRRRRRRLRGARKRAPRKDGRPAKGGRLGCILENASLTFLLIPLI